MLSKIQSGELEPLAELINEAHESNLLSLTKWLDRAIYLFHYLPAEQNFSQTERCNAVYALHRLKEHLMEAYFLQNGWHFERMD